MKKLLMVMNLFALNSFANESVNEIYNLSNDTMDVITHSKEFPSDGRFNLTTEETDLAFTLGKNDYYIGEYASAAKNSLTKDPDCTKDQYIPTEVEKKYSDRTFRIGAMSINSLTDFERSENFKYSKNEYTDYMSQKGYSVYPSAKYSWDNLIKRFKEYDPNADAGVNSEKLAIFIKKETGETFLRGSCF